MNEQLRAQLEEGRHLLPSYMWDGIENYFLHHVPVGSFMTAVLSNDLMGAAGKADDMNRRWLHQWCAFLYNHAPVGSFGSPEAVSAWLARREEKPE